MQNRPTFTSPNVWTGGDYELKLFLGAPSDLRIRTALRAIWCSPHVKGPFASRDVEPDKQQILTPDTLADRLFGLARMGTVFVPCSTFVVREEDADGNRCADFLSLYFSLSALSLVYPVGAYPFGDINDVATWRPDVDAWFLQFLRAQKGKVGFELAVLGWEPALTLADVTERKRNGIPADRFDGIVLPGADDIQWFPPTRHDPIRFS